LRLGQRIKPKVKHRLAAPGFEYFQIMRERQVRSKRDEIVMLEARGGIEPPIKVLQTFALPLGDRAFDAMSIDQLEIPAPFILRQMAMPGFLAR
jgi:hypothetical protein